MHWSNACTRSEHNQCILLYPKRNETTARSAHFELSEFTIISEDKSQCFPIFGWLGMKRLDIYAYVLWIPNIVCIGFPIKIPLEILSSLVFFFGGKEGVRAMYRDETYVQLLFLYTQTFHCRNQENLTRTWHTLFKHRKHTHISTHIMQDNEITACLNCTKMRTQDLE